MNRNASGRFTAAQDSINAERHTANVGTGSTEELTAMLSGINLKEIGAKLVIGYIYIITGWFAAWHVATIIALMTSIVWLQYVLLFVVAAVGMIAVVYTTSHVTNATYDGSMFVARKIGALFGKAKDMFNRPTEATVH